MAVSSNVLIMVKKSNIVVTGKIIEAISKIARKQIAPAALAAHTARRTLLLEDQSKETITAAVRTTRQEKDADDPTSDKNKMTVRTESTEEEVQMKTHKKSEKN